MGRTIRAGILYEQIVSATKLGTGYPFKDVFKAIFTKQNIKSRYITSVQSREYLSHLDLRLKTLILPPIEEQSWTSKIPQNPKELVRISRAVY